MHREDLYGCEVALWGFGREGRAAYAALRQVGVDVTVLNDGPLPAADRAAVGRVVEGEVGAALARFDVVVKSPGVSLHRPEVAAARARGVHFTSATQIWFDEHPELVTVAVTGTKGKSTTASLVAHLLRAAGLRVELRGNIGRPLLDDGAVDPDAVWVIEVSSYQAADLVASPRVSVLLDLYPEHLDWHGDVDTYFRDKLHLFVHQAHGVAVLNRRDEIVVRLTAALPRKVYFNDPEGFHVDGGFVCRGERRLIETARIPLRGAHNQSNVCAALTVLDQLGVELPPLAAVETFRGLPHRLFPLGERHGVLWVDDSISTTAESAMAAIESFAGREVTVLLGGYDRGIPYDGLARFLVEREIAAVVTLGRSGPRIAAAIRALGAPRPAVFEAADIEQAVARAREATPAGGVVLLSPAAPSYDQFRNFEERGDAFARAAGF